MIVPVLDMPRPLKPSPPEPALGSGKPETPFARMHFDTAAGEFAGPYGLDEPLCVEPELPQAAIARAQLAATSASDRLRP